MRSKSNIPNKLAEQLAQIIIYEIKSAVNYDDGRLIEISFKEGLNEVIDVFFTYYGYHVVRNK
jgi:hypothetical protein